MGADPPRPPDCPTRSRRCAIPAVEIKQDGRIWLPRLLSWPASPSGTNEARRLVEQGGVRLDGERVTDPAAEVPFRDGMVLQIGQGGLPASPG